MNYKNIYKNLIEKSRIREKLDKNNNIHRHHVKPKCMGGINDEVVYLYLREHFIAHRLLTKIFPKHWGILNAYLSMAVCNNNDKIIKSKEYQLLRLKWVEGIKGENHHFYGKPGPMTGKKLTTEQRSKIGRSGKDNAMFGKTRDQNHMFGKKHSEETKEKVRQKIKERGGYKGDKNPMFGKKQSEESRIKMSEKAKGRIAWNKGKTFKKENEKCLTLELQ